MTVSDSSTTPPADKLDLLLASRPVPAHNHFAERVRARLHEDPAEDAAELWVDHLLSESHVSPPDDFAEHVRRRILAGEGEAVEEKRMSYWRGLLPFAAAAGLLFGIISLSTTQPEQPIQVATLVDTLPSSFNTASGSVEAFAWENDGIAPAPALSAARLHSATPAAGNDDVARILVLASGLGLEARALIERPDYHSWLALAE
jgi:hypothetical protein